MICANPCWYVCSNCSHVFDDNEPRLTADYSSQGEQVFCNHMCCAFWESTNLKGTDDEEPPEQGEHPV